jgi:hypothetical protein
VDLQKDNRVKIDLLQHNSQQQLHTKSTIMNYFHKCSHRNELNIQTGFGSSSEDDDACHKG